MVCGVVYGCEAVTGQSVKVCQIFIKHYYTSDFCEIRSERLPYSDAEINNSQNKLTLMPNFIATKFNGSLWRRNRIGNDGRIKLKPAESNWISNKFHLVETSRWRMEAQCGMEICWWLRSSSSFFLRHINTINFYYNFINIFLSYLNVFNHMIFLFCVLKVIPQSICITSLVSRAKQFMNLFYCGLVQFGVFFLAYLELHSGSGWPKYMYIIEFTLLPNSFCPLRDKCMSCSCIPSI